MDEQTRQLITEIRDIQKENLELSKEARSRQKEVLELTKESQVRQKKIAEQYDQIQSMARLPLKAAPFLLVLILFLVGLVLWITFKFL